MPSEARFLKQAQREGWATYLPSPYLYASGFIAGLCVMLSPFLLNLIVGLIAFMGELVRLGHLDFYATFGVNWQASVYYARETGVYIWVGGAVGALLAYLRARRGFYFRHVKGHTYGERPRSPMYPHALLAIVAGPAILWGMAYQASPEVYPRVLYNAFAVWLTSGVAARYVWEFLQLGLLRLAGRFVGAPARSLRAEYQLKDLIDNDPVLSFFAVRDIHVDVENRHATVYGDIKGQGETRRLKELGGFVDGIHTIEVRESAGGSVILERRDRKSVV